MSGAADRLDKNGEQTGLSPTSATAFLSFSSKTENLPLNNTLLSMVFQAYARNIKMKRNYLHSQEAIV